MRPTSARRLAVIILATLAASLWAASSSAVTPASGQLLWKKLYAADAAYAVAVSPDGSKVFVGGSRQVVAGHNGEYELVAYTSGGTKLWSKTYVSTGANGGTIRAIAVGPGGGRVFVTGDSTHPHGEDPDIVTIAYRVSDGARLWLRRVDGSAHSNDNGFSIDVAPDGSAVFVGGVVTGTDSYYDYFTIAYGTITGDKRWMRTYDGSGNGGEDLAYGLDAGPDGVAVAVTGYSQNAAGGVDVATVSYDADTGMKRWATRYNGVGDDNDYGNDVVVGPDGTVYVGGGSGRDDSANFSDYVTLAYDADSGEESWAKLYDGGALRQDVATSIAVTPDGSSVVVSGYSQPSPSDFDIATVAYDTVAGAKKWAKRYGDPVGNFDDARDVDVEITPDGSKAIVSGTSNQQYSGLDLVTAEYAVSDGARPWLKLFDRCEGTETAAADVAIGPGGGRSFLAGSGICPDVPDSGRWEILAYAT